MQGTQDTQVHASRCTWAPDTPTPNMPQVTGQRVEATSHGWPGLQAPVAHARPRAGFSQDWKHSGEMKTPHRPPSAHRQDTCQAHSL